MADQDILNADEEIERLVKLADEEGVGEEALDEEVHDTASNIASNVNNEGVRSQIEFLISHGGPGAVARIEQLIKMED